MESNDGGLTEWLLANKFTLNLNKTKRIIFSLRNVEDLNANLVNWDKQVKLREVFLGQSLVFNVSYYKYFLMGGTYLDYTAGNWESDRLYIY